MNPHGHPISQRIQITVSAQPTNDSSRPCAYAESIRRPRQPQGAERTEPREVVTDDEQRARGLARGQDPAHLLQRLLPQQVRLAEEVLHGGELAHGDGHLAHVVGDAVGGARRGGGGERVPEGLLQGLHPLRQRVLGLLQRLLQAADAHQLLLRQRLHVPRQHLEQLRRPEPAQPHEEPLRGAHPHARQHVEHVRPRGHALEPEHLVVVQHRAVHQHAQVVVADLRAQGHPEVVHVVLVLVQPPRVLQVERQRTCKDTG
uniref:Uncharacterized protein n=1 Tax=Zea mays TaxID=4577 RepID=C0HIP9_MAIZE|nr:unknown [Zea mays]